MAITDRDPPAVLNHGVPVAPLRKSRLHPSLRLPMLMVLNLTLQSSLLTFASGFMNNELGAVSRTGEKSPPEILAYLGSKLAVLWFEWRAGLDSIEASCVTVVANTPFAYLLLTYYAIPAQTVAILLATEVFAVAFPTFLLQRPSAAHNPRAKLRKRFLLESLQVQHSTNALSIVVFITLVYLSQTTGTLNRFLISHFGIPTVELAYQETVLSIFSKVVFAALATKEFLLNPAIAAEGASGRDTPVTEFDPATADLPSTLKHNFWFFTKQTRALIRNTLILSAITFVTTVQRTLTLDQTDVPGAAGYGAFWVAAILVNAGWLSWIGDTTAEA